MGDLTDSALAAFMGVERTRGEIQRDEEAAAYAISQKAVELAVRMEAARREAAPPKVPGKKPKKTTAKKQGKGEKPKTEWRAGKNGGSFKAVVSSRPPRRKPPPATSKGEEGQAATSKGDGLSFYGHHHKDDAKMYYSQNPEMYALAYVVWGHLLKIASFKRSLEFEASDSYIATATGLSRNAVRTRMKFLEGLGMVKSVSAMNPLTQQREPFIRTIYPAGVLGNRKAKGKAGDSDKPSTESLETPQEEPSNESQSWKAGEF